MTWRKFALLCAAGFTVGAATTLLVLTAFVDRVIHGGSLMKETDCLWSRTSSQ